MVGHQGKLWNNALKRIIVEIWEIAFCDEIVCKPADISSLCDQRRYSYSQENGTWKWNLPSQNNRFRNESMLECYIAEPKQFNLSSTRVGSRGFASYSRWRLQKSWFLEYGGSSCSNKPSE